MLHTIIQSLDQQLGFKKASAHCDIPCKIYDPVTAQISALTVIRMMDLIEDISNKSPLSIDDQAELFRLISQKEKHAEQAKHEIRVIWGDYFKKPQIEQIEGIHDLVHNIMMQGSKCKQKTQQEYGTEFLDLINQFAEAFWKTKGLETYIAMCPYPPNQSIVHPVLSN